MNRFARLATGLLLAAPAAAAVAGSAHAAPAATATITHACTPNMGNDFSWTASVDNITGSPIDIVFEVDGSVANQMTLQGFATGHLGGNATEGLASTAVVKINGVVAATDSVGLVDCHPDGTPTAEIDVVCPEPGSAQDIILRYRMTILGAAMTFDYSSDGSGAQQFVSNDSVTSSTKVAEGDVVDAWVRRHDTQEVLAVLNTTVDCIPDASTTTVTPTTVTPTTVTPTTAASAETPVTSVPATTAVDADSASLSATSSELPATGSNAAGVAWLAAALTLAGIALVRSGRRTA